jgi:hypothetical protein
VAGVLCPVEREHARAHDHAGGEAGIVDREGRVVPHRPKRELTARDEPAAESRQPGHGLALAQPREQGMRIQLELAEGDRGADRERGLARRRFTHGRSAGP